MNTHPIRLLIHTEQDMTRYAAITGVLIHAADAYPETFDIVVGQDGIKDHVGYHDSTLSSVVWTREDGTAYMRLTIRPGRHEVFDALLAAAIAPTE